MTSDSSQLCTNMVNKVFGWLRDSQKDEFFFCLTLRARNVLSLDWRKEGTKMAVKTRANEESICRICERMNVCVCVCLHVTC